MQRSKEPEKTIFPFAHFGGHFGFSTWIPLKFCCPWRINYIERSFERLNLQDKFAAYTWYAIVCYLSSVQFSCDIGTVCPTTGLSHTETQYIPLSFKTNVLASLRYA